MGMNLKIEDLLKKIMLPQRYFNNNFIISEKYREETKFEKMEYEKYIWLGKLIFKVAYKKNAPLYNTAIEILNKMNDEIDNIITLAVINGINVDSYVNKYIATTY